MGAVLFWMSILATVGTLVIPLTHKTRAAAVFSWFSQWLGAATFSWFRSDYLPSWEEPAWYHGLGWFLASWLFFIIGFIVAVRKPRKRDLVAATN